MSRQLDDLLSDPEFQRRLRRRIEEGWTFDKIERMSTAKIFGVLNRLGINVTPEDYRRASLRHDSAGRLADEWLEQRLFRPEGHYDDDFVWMASIVLWKRLIPDRVCFEQIDDLMQEGYDLLEAQRTAEACDVWWQVWEWLKDKVTPERNTLAALDKDFRGFQSILNWCQDFEMELGNAGHDAPKYFQLRIRYCQEFLALFPGIEWLMRGNFLRAEARSYWRLGDVETAEEKFEALIDANPDWPWGYIDWSDLNWWYTGSPKDYRRATWILKRALKRPHVQERDAVLERLRGLRKEKKESMEQQKRRKARGRRGR